MVTAAIAVTAANNMTVTTGRLIGFLLLVGGFAAAFFLVQFFVSGNISNSEQSSVPAWLSTTIQKQRSGDFAGALAEARSIQNDPNSSAEEKALATYNTLGAEFRLTGDINTRLSDVRKMKAIVLDESVSLKTRANVLNNLAAAYSNSGATPSVADEIFKDEPFRQYYSAAEDPDRMVRLSTRKLFEWSYSMNPTSYAAISIARWYSEQQAFNPGLATSTLRAYADLAEDYLKKADAASEEEMREDRTYSDSVRYLVYRHWRTVVIGRLAAPDRPEYQKIFRSTYDEFITFTQTQQNVLARGFLFYARLYYASKLSRVGDDANAKIQLDLLAGELNSVPDPSTNIFLRFLRNEHEERPTGASWINLVESKYALSPAFKAAVEKVLASPLQ